MKRVLIGSLMLACVGVIDAEIVSVDGLIVDINPQGSCVIGVSEDGAQTQEEITIPASVTYEGLSYRIDRVEESAFQDNETLKKLIIDAPVTSIPAYMCNGAKSLEKVILPSTISRIEEGAFALCDKLMEIECDNNLLSNLEIIGEKAFYQCSALQSFPNTPSLQVLGESSMMNCASLKRFDFSTQIRRIGTNAFNGCEQLEEAVIPGGLQQMGTGVFDGCASLKKIKIEKDINILPDYSFRNCVALSDFPFEIIKKEIGESCFENCRNLKNLSIEETVDKIGRYCFRGCEAIESVNISCVSNMLAEGVFKDCKNLEFISIGGSVEEICEHAFFNCINLKTIELNKSISRLGREVFEGCLQLTEIYCDNDIPPVIDDTTFPTMTYVEGHLYVPDGKESVYSQTAVWDRFIYVKGVSEFPTHSGIVENPIDTTIDIVREGENLRLNKSTETPLRIVSLDGREYGLLKGNAGETVPIGSAKIVVIENKGKATKFYIP